MLFLIITILVAYAACDHATKAISQTGKVMPWMLALQFWYFVVLVSLLSTLSLFDIWIDPRITIAVSMLASWEIAQWLVALAIISPSLSNECQEPRETWQVGERVGDLTNRDLFRFWWQLLYSNRVCSFCEDARPMINQLLQGNIEIDQFSRLLGEGVKAAITKDGDMVKITLSSDEGSIYLKAAPSNPVIFGWNLNKPSPGTSLYTERNSDFLKSTADARSP